MVGRMWRRRNPLGRMVGTASLLSLSAWELVSVARRQGCAGQSHREGGSVRGSLLGAKGARLILRCQRTWTPRVAGAKPPWTFVSPPDAPRVSGHRVQGQPSSSSAPVLATIAVMSVRGGGEECHRRHRSVLSAHF